MRKLNKSELKRVYGAAHGKDMPGNGEHLGYKIGDEITIISAATNQSGGAVSDPAGD